MIVIAVNNINYTVPTKWEDVTWNQYQQVVANSEPLNVFKVLTGITKPLPISTLADILRLLSFTESHDDLPVLSKPFDSKDVGQEPYGKLENAKVALKKYNDPMEAGAEIVELYTGQEILSMPVTEVYNMVAFFLALSQNS